MVKLNVKKQELKKEELEKLLKDEGISKSEKMRILLWNGYDVKEVSQILGVRYNYVYNVFSNMIIKEGIEDIVKEKKTGKKDIIIEKWLEGKSNIEIARELRINYNYVWKTVNDAMNDEKLRKEFEKRRKSEKNKK